jgi:hypothetical protein
VVQETLPSPWLNAVHVSSARIQEIPLGLGNPRLPSGLLVVLRLGEMLRTCDSSLSLSLSLVDALDCDGSDSKKHKRQE